jgi:flagellar basal body P-ring formation protein FlgA
MSHPLILVALAAALLFAARAVGAQQTQRPVRHVAIATHALVRGAALTADDIEYRDSTVRMPADTNRVAPGWVTRRAIAAGEVLRAPAVEAPAAVSANQSVEVEFNDENVRLTLRGIVSRTAPIGDHVTVRIESGRRVDGVVVGPGRVRIS